MSQDDNIDIEQKLIEEHEDDFATDNQADNTSTDDKGNDNGGDNSQDKSEDASNGDVDNSKNDEAESSDNEDGEDGQEASEGEDKSGESDDSQDTKTERMGEKKDANSRIRQLNEEKKRLEEEKRQIEEKLAEKEAAERREIELAEDPVYTLDDFIGTVDENGDPLTDGEATARFRAWEADYKYRQLQKQLVLKEQQDTLLQLQSQTKEAFTKFPEFNASSDKYDPELASIANEAFRAGLIYQDGHDGDDRYIIGSRIHPGELLEKLHKLRIQDTKVTKVNNLGDDNGTVIGTQQVTKKVNQYAPGFRGEVDKEIDKLMKGNK